MLCLTNKVPQRMSGQRRCSRLELQMRSLLVHHTSTEYRARRVQRFVNDDGTLFCWSSLANTSRAADAPTLIDNC